MDVPLNEDQKRMLEEFLQELLLVTKDGAAVDVLLDTLLAMNGNEILCQDGKISSLEPINGTGSRCHLFKMLPEGVEWVGFVREPERALDMLLGLAVEKSAFYFLYDENSGKVLELPQAGSGDPSSECN